MAAPTINATVHQYTTTQPYQPVVVSLGMNQMRVTSASDWTQSTANSNEYYYTGTQFWTDAAFDVRARESVVAFREGTLGSLPTYGYAWGDNDSIGSDTLYVRTNDSTAPADNEIRIAWDESKSGDANPNSKCTVEWWLDLDDEDTATAVSGWDADYRYFKDWRSWYLFGLITGNFNVSPPMVDKAGRVPTATTTSPMRGWQYIACLPAGTFSLKCRVTNGDREQTTETISITVAADTRGERTVHATNPAADHTTLVAALAAASINDRIIVLDGHTETISSTVSFNNKHGVLVTAEGANTITGGANTTLISVFGSYCTFQGLNFEQTTASAWPPFRLLRNDALAIVNCWIGATSDPYYFGSFLDLSPDDSSRPDGHFGALIQGGGADLYQSYLIKGGTETGHFIDVRIEGCDLWGDDTLGEDRYVSVTESGIRDVIRIKTQTISHTRVRQTEKDAIRFTGMDCGYVYGSVWNGAFRLGAATNDTVNYNCRIESCYGYRDQGGAVDDLSPMTLKPGVREATIVNNIFNEAAPISGLKCISCADDPGDDATYYVGLQAHSDISVIHNTLIATNTANGGFYGSTGTYVTGCVFEGNYVLTPSGYAATAIVSGDWTTTGNSTATGELDATLNPDPTPGSDTTLDGAYDNFFGVVRDATSYYGASAVFDAPSVANRTPADNATGVTTAATISLQFDQNMAVNSGAASIELRQVGTDAVIDSITAGDATINISDRTQVTLTGLSTTDATGNVYVYIPATAFKSASTNVAYEGDLTATDWNFSMFAVSTTVSAPARGRARRRTR